MSQATNALALLIPAPRLLELDHVDMRAKPDAIWQLVRHGDLARTPLIRGLFWLRALPDLIAGRPRVDSSIRLDDLVSTAERPGFQILASAAPYELCVGAIGKVWQPEIPFVHVPDAEAYAAFEQSGFIKVAWALRIEALETCSRLLIEVRVDATDAAAWQHFEHYFRWIGPASRLIRRSALASIAHEFGSLAEEDEHSVLPGDELLPDASAQMTHGVTIEAPAEKIWPWLMQMGCGQAGFYSYDVLDNAGKRSALEIHPELQQLELGDSVVNTPDGDGSFEVVRLDPQRVLVLGGLFDPRSAKRLPFTAARPEHYWHVSWAFVLEPITTTATRLHVRARAAFPASGAWHAFLMRPVHHVMESAQLRHLKTRVEATLARADVTT